MCRTSMQYYPGSCPPFPFVDCVWIGQETCLVRVIIAKRCVLQSSTLSASTQDAQGLPLLAGEIAIPGAHVVKGDGPRGEEKG